jgi:hypothetical protein
MSITVQKIEKKNSERKKEKSIDIVSSYIISKISKSQNNENHSKRGNRSNKIFIFHIYMVEFIFLKDVSRNFQNCSIELLKTCHGVRI